MSNNIIFRIKKHLGIIILNNPKKLNSLSLKMIKELNQILDKIKKSKLKVIIIKGAGNAFCSGGDISWEIEAGNMTRKKAKDQITYVQKVFSEIEKLPQVFIALIKGHAIGGGNELAMSCDVRIALPSAKFTHPETSLGTIAPLGGTKRLPRLIGLGRAKYMLFTGETINSKTAFEWGLVDFVVSEKDVNIFLDSIVSRISKNSAIAIDLTKKSVNSNYLKDLNDQFEVNSYIQCSRTKENKEILNKLFKKMEK